MAKSETGTRYRRISLKINADEKFRALSHPQPCGKYLWLHLLHGPHTGLIPGLSRTGKARLAEDLRWPMKGLEAAWSEIEVKEMARADWEAQLLWLPNAIKHNPPRSANVIRNWRDAWEELPECSLKGEAHVVLKAFLVGMGPSFAEAFREVFGEVFRNVIRKDFWKDIPEDFREPGTGTGTGTGESEQAHSERDDANFGDAFHEVVWPIYPNHSDEVAAARKWFELCRDGRIRLDGTVGRVPTSRTVSEVRDCIAAHVASDRWQEQGGKFVPKLANFLERGGHLNFPPPPGSQAAKSNSRRTAGGASGIAPGFNPLEPE